jgi:hypothetical protein
VITRKSQGLAEVIANFRRIHAKRYGLGELRRSSAKIPRAQARHGLFKQRPAIGGRCHPAIA